MTKHAWRAAADTVSGIQQMESADICFTPVPRFRRQRGTRSREVSAHPFSQPNSALAQEWDALAEQVGASPYLRPGWVAAWWRAFGIGDLAILTLRKNRRLVAVLPVIKRHGTLKSVANGHSPRFGLLAENLDSATELARTLFTEKPWRIFIAALDPAGISMKAFWRAAEGTGYKTVICLHQRSPYLEIKQDWSEYESQLSKALLTSLHRSKRKLDKHGAVSMQVVDGHERLKEFLEEAFSVEASGWKGAQHTAIQSTPETMRFYTDVARWAVARGMLRIFFLRLEQRPLAMYYALLDGGVCYLLKGGYDAAYARYSPGKTLMHEVVRHCFSAGLSSIEFHGDANQYKFRWANAVHAQKRFEAYSPSPAGQLAWAALVYGKPAAKYLLRCLGTRKRDAKHEHSQVIRKN